MDIDSGQFREDSLSNAEKVLNTFSSDLKKAEEALSCAEQETEKLEEEIRKLTAEIEKLSPFRNRKREIDSRKKTEKFSFLKNDISHTEQNLARIKALTEEYSHREDEIKKQNRNRDKKA